MEKIAARYAKALLQLAVEKKALTSIHQDMVYLTQACAANPMLLHTLKSPIVKHSKKLAVLQTIFQQKANELTLRFFALVVHHHREAWLLAMAQAFLVQHKQYQGITQAHVTSAIPLSAELMLELQQMIHKITPSQRVELHQHVDHTVIGGYVLEVEGKRLDMSLRKRLLKFRKDYVTSGY